MSRAQKVWSDYLAAVLSTDICGSQPAIGPTTGSLAYLFSAQASVSSQGRNSSRGVSSAVILSNHLRKLQHTSLLDNDIDSQRGLVAVGHL